MKIVPSLIVAFTFALSACGRKQPATPPAQPDEAKQGDTTTATAQENIDSATQPPPAAAANPARAPVAAGQGINGPVHPFLTQELRAFVQQRGRLPESIAELVGARLDSVPRLPNGLIYVIDPVTQEVKVVRE